MVLVSWNFFLSDVVSVILCVVAGLSPEAVVTAAQSMEEVFYKKGDVIIEQDDIGESFYVLEEGLVSVTVSWIIILH